MLHLTFECCNIRRSIRMYNIHLCTSTNAGICNERNKFIRWSQCKVVIEFMLDYCMMTQLQHYLFMYTTASISPSNMQIWSFSYMCSVSCLFSNYRLPKLPHISQYGYYHIQKLSHLCYNALRLQKLFKWIIMSLRISLKCKCVRFRQYFSGFAGTSTGTVICLKEWAVKVKQVATAWLYHFSQQSYTVDSTKNPLVCAIKLP